LGNSRAFFVDNEKPLAYDFCSGVLPDELIRISSPRRTSGS
jgi:hypothetical protein